MKYLLKLHVWQLFLLLCGLPLFVGFFGPGLMNFFNKKWIVSLIASVQMLLVIGILFSWFWAVGITSNEKVKPEIRMKVGVFKSSLAYSIIWWLIYLVYWTRKSQLLGDLLEQNDITAIMGQFSSWDYLLVMVFQSIAMICMFYVSYFIAKNLVMAEKQKKVTFNEFRNVLFSLWFLPIGIWLINLYE
ncbi:MAG: hypothetical protein GY796_35635 [Chloroflexi bacterium]|nr:hypothetical protein [Chloroflexota bacterium]